MALSARATRQAVLAVGVLMMGSAAYGQPNACTYTFTRGNGPTLIKYCVNDDGRMPSFVTPFGEHIKQANAREGYLVCSQGQNPLYAYDFGTISNFNWGPSVRLNEPTASGVRLSRTTADGRLRIEHGFKVDGTEGDVTVTVKLVNTGTTALTNLLYKRVVDFDMSGQPSNLWTRSVDEVDAVTTGVAITPAGASLNLTAFGTSHFTAIAPTANVTDCGGPVSDFQTNGAVGDFAAHGLYYVGDLAPGRNRTVTFVYKRK